MSLTSVAMIGLFAVVMLLIARAKIREKEAEVARMATMMGLQNVSPEALQAVSPQILQKVSPEVLPPELAKVSTNGDSEVHEWSFGDKPEDMSKPGVHFRTNVKVQVIRKRL